MPHCSSAIYNIKQEHGQLDQLDHHAASSPSIERPLQVPSLSCLAVILPVDETFVSGAISKEQV